MRLLDHDFPPLDSRLTRPCFSTSRLQRPGAGTTWVTVLFDFGQLWFYSTLDNFGFIRLWTTLVLFDFGFFETSRTSLT